MKLSHASIALISGLALGGAAVLAEETATQQVASLQRAEIHRVLISKPQLVWPHEVAQDFGGKVRVHYTIEPDGHVANVTSDAGSNYFFAKAARQAVQQFVFTPAPAASEGSAVALFHPAP
jgi:TonB family protein